jgi:dihydrolipoamide dehydrogenase
MGINVENVSLNLDDMMSYKDEGIDGNVKGIEFLFKKNKVTGIFAEAKILSSDQINLKLSDGSEKLIEADNIVIATGSSSASLPGIEVNESNIVSSTGALSLKNVPDRMIIIGGGYIGLELGSVWSRLGSDVTVVEYLDRIAPGLDGELSVQFEKILKKQGINFILGSKVTGTEVTSDGVQVNIENVSTSDASSLNTDVVLVSTGRVPNTNGLFDDSLGIQLNEKGFIKTDKNYRTDVSGIWAIGDVIEGPMLAHKAEEEGVAVAELIKGKPGHVNYGIIPSVVYTNPEVASVGMTEEELKQKSISYKVGKFPFLANGRAKVNKMTDGFVKILSSEDTDQILGVHILGAHAGTMIAEAAVAMEFEATSEDLAHICHAHPTLSEAVKEAALAIDDRALHM